MGGMAAVHRAETRGIEGFRKPVALKRMLPSVASNADFVEAFIREARIASHLRHVNVAQTYELGKVGDIYFIAMELVTGRNLRQILRHCAHLTGQMPVAITLNILNQICDALDYAHNLCDETGQKLGIIHRDVSPSNIIVSDDGVVKLIDFGIAKASAAGMQTMSGMLKGKFGYMAPEYIAGSIDARADLFALGVIAHELLTNRPLFTSSDDMETLNRIRNMPIKPPSARNPRVPKEIDELVMTALERDPERRWQHATALRSALTTMTKRLALDVMNGEVAEWVDWVFEQSKHEGVVAPLQDPTDVAPLEAPTMAALLTPVTTMRPDNRAREPERHEAGDSLRMTTKRTITPAPHIPLADPLSPAAPRQPARTLMGGNEPAPRASAPNLAAQAPRYASVPPLRGSDPGISVRPPPAAFGAGSTPGGGGTRLNEDTKIVAPMPTVGGASAALPAARGRGVRDGLGLIAFLVIVVAVATVAVLYFALT